MASSFKRGLVVFLCAAALWVAGCRQQETNVVFDIKLDRFLKDGRPVIEIQPNGKPRPKGEGPYGDYYLVLRGGEMPYTRQFDTDQAAKGVELDFAVTKKNFKSADDLTIAVENPKNGSFDDTVILSNVITLEFP